MTFAIGNSLPEPNVLPDMEDDSFVRVAGELLSGCLSPGVIGSLPQYFGDRSLGGESMPGQPLKDWQSGAPGGVCYVRRSIMRCCFSGHSRVSDADRKKFEAVTLWLVVEDDIDNHMPRELKVIVEQADPDEPDDLTRKTVIDLAAYVLELRGSDGKPFHYELLLDDELWPQVERLKSRLLHMLHALYALPR